MDIVIDPEFEALCPPLSEEEAMHLEADIVRFGCRDPIVVWGTKNILVDGHNRYRICTKNKVPFKVHKIEFTDRRHARGWIITNQLGRRNLTPEQKSYLRGIRFNTEKQERGGDRKSKSQSETLIGATAVRVASEEKVSRPTVYRDAEYAEAVTELEKTHGPTARVAVLNRDTGLTKKDTLRLVSERPEVQAAVLSDKQKRREWKQAAEPISDAEATEKQVAAVMAAWNRCGPEAREIVRARIAEAATALRDRA